MEIMVVTMSKAGDLAIKTGPLLKVSLYLVEQLDRQLGREKHYGWGIFGPKSYDLKHRLIERSVCLD